MPTPHSTARRRPALATLGAALSLGVTVLFSAGCGSGSALYETGKSGDQAAGKELFVQKCGSCHTLGDAGTTGQIGPNLDYAFYASRRDGLGESTFVQVVRGQIAYPIAHTSTGAPGMPKNLVTGHQAGKAVFTSAGCAGCHTLADAGSTGNVGPNLDEAKPDEALVKERVTNGKAPMPSFKGQLSDQQIADVAAYVASVAGK